MKFLVSEKQIHKIFNLLAEESKKQEFAGKKVMVYFNLHKKTFSVKKDSKVILHADYLKLEDVTFKVRQGGKTRVRNEKQKNVHAFVIGTLVDYCEYPCSSIPKEPNEKIVTYNPYRHDTFVYKDNDEPIENAKEVVLINRRNKLFIIKD
jgi:hypothetical protein